MAELMTARLPELVNAKIDRCPHWERKKATSLVALIEQQRSMMCDGRVRRRSKPFVFGRRWPKLRTQLAVG